jgi:hypothetical protein
VVTPGKAAKTDHHQWQRSRPPPRIAASVRPCTSPATLEVGRMKVAPWFGFIPGPSGIHATRTGRPAAGGASCPGGHQAQTTRPESRGSHNQMSICSSTRPLTRVRSASNAGNEPESPRVATFDRVGCRKCPASFVGCRFQQGLPGRLSFSTGYALRLSYSTGLSR